MITGKNLIGYDYRKKKNKTFSRSFIVSGASEDVFFQEASEDEVSTAANLAASAFQEYRKLSGSEKAGFLEKIANAISSSKDDLVSMAMQETNLGKARLEGEVQRTINQIKLFSSILKEGSWVKAILDTAQPNRQPLPKPDLRQLQIALGPVAVFGASNFPFAFSVAGGDTVSALAAGCTVVFKAHPGHPATSEMVGEVIMKACKECNLPEGVFSLIQGEKYEGGIALVTHAAIKAVAFTGSLGGGKALFDAAAKRDEPIPVYAEMGSINPVFILREMLKKNAASIADKLAPSNMLSAGQFCTNPGFIISLKSHDESPFLQQFASHIKESSGECMLTDSIYKGYNAGVKKLIDTEGVAMLTTGKESDAPNTAIPYMFQTTASVLIEHKEILEEVFGPCSVHVTADSMEQMTSVANNLDGQLTVTVWGTENDLKDCSDLIDVLEQKSGRILYNGVPTGVEVTHAMVHGGPYPATTDSRITSVGTTAIYRFTRPVCYQNSPQNLLPVELRDENNLNIWRFVNGDFSKDNIRQES